MNLTAVILGCLTAIIFVFGLIAASVIYDDQVTNKIEYSKQITVSGKICDYKLLGNTVSKVQSDDGEIYFVASGACNELHEGENRNITYIRIRNGANENFVYNQIVSMSGDQLK